MPESFISAYLNHTLVYETPTSFWKWSAYSTISSILKDRCYMRSGDSLLFPNLYIMLLAESSGHRKNNPITLSESIVKSVDSNYKVISGFTSVPAIMDKLSNTETDKNGKVIKSSAATFFAKEFSASIVNDPQGLKRLTDIYDYDTNAYIHALRTGPTFSLEKLVFSMFTASNQDMLKGLFDQSVIRGGFMARTLLIVPNEIREGKTLFEIDHEKLKISRLHVESLLRKIGNLTGEFRFNEDAVEEYTKWYKPFRADYTKKKEATGVVGRIHTHALKIAMILAANELTLCVQQRHVEQSIQECCDLLSNYNLFTMNNTKTEIGNVGGIVITELMTAHNYIMSRKDVMKNNWQNFDSELLDKATLALADAGMLTILHLKDGIHFQLTAQCIDMLK